MSLDPRLQAAADAVRRGSVAADIGADHGYLICDLVASGKCPEGYAADINEGPLEAARRHVRERGLEEKIRLVLSDGLAGLPKRGIDDVIIAGMGGELIAAILDACLWVRDPAKRLVLQPMTRAGHLRRQLYRTGFELLEERPVISGRFCYAVMTARYCGQNKDIIPLFAETGLILEQTTPAAAGYLEQVVRRLEGQMKGQARAGQDIRDLAALTAAIREKITC